jgi:hypothetical protein
VLLLQRIEVMLEIGVAVRGVTAVAAMAFNNRSPARILVRPSVTIGCTRLCGNGGDSSSLETSRVPG